MRKFFSYGLLDQQLHYYVPRQELISGITQQLKGDNPDQGGHYLTVWAPRQTGKSWIMQQVFSTLKRENQFDVVILPLQYIYNVSDINQVAQLIAQELMENLNLKNLTIDTLGDFHRLFKRGILSKPLILIVEQISLGKNYVKFPCPYVQKRLFNAFNRALFPEMGRLYDPFEDLSDTITEDSLNIRRLLQRYEHYLQANRQQVLKNAPRRQKDLRVYEAVFHFHLYSYLASFLQSYDAQVQPEFPTGNGAIDLLIRHAGLLFGLELKSFANQREYRQALTQAAQYGKQLGLTEIGLALFIETVDETNRQKFERDYTDSETGVTVHPQFIQTGKS